MLSSTPQPMLDDPDDLIQRAIAEEKAGQSEPALAYYTQVINDNPKHVLALEKRARLLGSLKQSQQALNDLAERKKILAERDYFYDNYVGSLKQCYLHASSRETQALAILFDSKDEEEKIKSASHLAYLATTYLEKNNFKAAESYYKKALAFFPHDVYSRTNLVKMQLTFDLTTAEKEIDDIIETYSYSLAYLLRAKLSRKANNHEAEKQDLFKYLLYYHDFFFQSAGAIANNKVITMFELDVTLNEDTQTAKSINKITREIGKNPKDPTLFIERGLLCLTSNNIQSAYVNIMIAMALCVEQYDLFTFTSFIRQYIKRDHYPIRITKSVVLDHLNELNSFQDLAKKLNPTIVEALHHLALLEQQKKNFKEACLIYEIAIKIDSSPTKLILDYASLNVDLMDLVTAQQLIDNITTSLDLKDNAGIVKENAQFREVRKKLLAAARNSLRIEGKEKKLSAERNAEQILLISARNTVNEKNYYEVMKEINDILQLDNYNFAAKADFALTLASALTAKYPQFPGAYYLKAQYLVKLGKYKEALMSLNKYIQICPYMVEVFETRARVHAKLNDNKAAQEDKKTCATIEKERIAIMDVAHRESFINAYPYIKRQSAVKQEVIYCIHDLLSFYCAHRAKLESNSELAMHFYSICIENNADDFISLTERALLYKEMKEYNKALADLNRALSFTPYSKAYWLRAHLQNDSALALADIKLSICYAKSDADFASLSSDKTFILKLLLDGSDKHEDAETFFLKRAESHKECKAIDDAIIDYSTVIWLKHGATDLHAIYFERCLLLLQNLDPEVALYDFVVSKQLCLKSDLVNKEQLLEDRLTAYVQNCIHFANQQIVAGNLYPAFYFMLTAFAIKELNEEMFNTALAVFNQLKEDDFLSVFMLKASFYFLVEPQIQANIDRILKFLLVVLINNTALTFNDFLQAKEQRVIEVSDAPKLKKKVKKSQPSNQPVISSATHSKKKYHDKNDNTSPPETKEKIIKLTSKELDANFKKMNDAARAEKLAKEKERKEHNKQKGKTKKEEQLKQRREKIRKILAAKPESTEEAKEMLVEDTEVKVESTCIANLQQFNIFNKPAPQKLKIKLTEAESVIAGRFKQYKADFSKAQPDEKPPETLITGGSVQNRVTPQLKKLLSPPQHADDCDSDWATEMSPKDLEVLFHDLKIRKSPHVEGLYQIKYKDSKGHFTKIDIFCVKKLYPLQNNARKRHYGYLFSDLDGNVINPLGEAVLNDIINNRLRTYYPLKNIFTGIPVNDDDVYDSQAPVRILLLINQCIKRKYQIVDRELRAQIKMDKPLLIKDEISGGTINSQMRKLFTNHYALGSFDMLNQFEILDTLFANIKNELRQDRDWLREQMVETDFIKRPSLQHIYAKFIVSAACQRMGGESALANMTESSYRFLVEAKSNVIIRESKYFTDTFPPELNIKRFIYPALSHWLTGHPNIQAVLENNNKIPTTSLTNTDCKR